MTIGSFSTANNSTQSGAVTLQSGNTVSAVPGTVTVKGGSGGSNSTAAGGAVVIQGGTGSTWAGIGSAGTGGSVTITGGPGGVNSNTTTAVGGTGSAITLTTGAGGNATGGSGSRTGGNSGTLTLATGAVGTGATANGTVGSIVLSPGGVAMATISSTGMTVGGATITDNGNSTEFRGSSSTCGFAIARTLNVPLIWGSSPSLHFIDGTGSAGNTVAQIQYSANVFTFKAGSAGAGVFGISTTGGINSGGLITLGGSTSSNPAIKRNAAGIDIRLADDSDYTKLACSYITWQGQKRVTSPFIVSSSTSLANITELVIPSLTAGNTYEFVAKLFVNADVTGGSKFCIGGTALPYNIIYQIMYADNATKAYTIMSTQTGISGSVGQAGSTAGFCVIDGTVTVSGSGTLSVCFAQNVGAGTSSVLSGSKFIVNQIV